MGWNRISTLIFPKYSVDHDCVDSGDICKVLYADIQLTYLPLGILISYFIWTMFRGIPQSFLFLISEIPVMQIIKSTSYGYIGLW